MINYPSSNNFGTILLLAVLFIGMGLLIYHTGEISIENGQLKETVGTLQESVAILDGENAALKTENTRITAENLTLVEENSYVKSALEETLAENTTLKADDAVMLAEVESLRLENFDLKLENQRLEALLVPSTRSGNAAFEVDQASFLPKDSGVWTKLAVAAMLAAIPFEGFTVYAMYKHLRRKRATALNSNYNELSVSRKNRNTYVVDSRFSNR